MIYIVRLSFETFSREIDLTTKTVRCDTRTLIKALQSPDITVLSAHYASEKLEPVDKYEKFQL